MRRLPRARRADSPVQTAIIESATPLRRFTAGLIRRVAALAPWALAPWFAVCKSGNHPAFEILWRETR